MDYSSNFCFITHLEDFSSEEILRVKYQSKQIASVCGNIVQKCRSDNGRFSNRAFLEDAHSLDQQIELCSVGTYH